MTIASGIPGFVKRSDTDLVFVLVIGN